jgi:alpha-tubulin suppressor-like RCC1 family protein
VCDGGSEQPVCQCFPEFHAEGLACVADDCTAGISRAEFLCDGGDVYWFDSCGQKEALAQTCCGAGCAGTQCLPPASHATTGCDSGDVYWFDSCNARQDVFAVCGAGNYCANGECVPIKILPGHYFSCAKFGANILKCWGDETFGQLGNESAQSVGDGPNEMGAALKPVVFPSNVALREVYIGAYTGCGVFLDDTTRCWGYNAEGQLGQGNTTSRGALAGDMGNNLPVLDLGAGLRVANLGLMRRAGCAIFDDYRVKCWGGNNYGQLGCGDTANRGDDPGEMGDNLPFVALGSGLRPTKIAGGFDFNCSLFDDGRIKCWGANSAGQLGLGDAASRGDNPNEMGDNLPFVDLGAGISVMDFATGVNHACALLDNHQIKCWGSGIDGALGSGDIADRGAALGQMGDLLPYVDLGNGRTVLAVGAGNQFTCAHLDDMTVKCWGRNTVGQLGQGDILNLGDQTGEMGDNLPTVSIGDGLLVQQLAVARDYVCVVVNGSRVKCWGSGGALGLGDTLNRGDNPGEMGDNLPFVDLGQ